MDAERDTENVDFSGYRELQLNFETEDQGTNYEDVVYEERYYQETHNPEADCQGTYTPEDGRRSPVTGTPSLEHTATAFASAKKQKRNRGRTTPVRQESLAPESRFGRTRIQIDNALKQIADSINKFPAKEEQEENSCKKVKKNIQDLMLMQIQMGAAFGGSFTEGKEATGERALGM
ncbi:hypothetical protein PsorP6_015890 [Peronosclerospora sorghi]|uniref:Uncharacterized protein n=1 Tax=Peronosclerospora sorghi TaxID=230839 RepID=A0ACC0WR44_9STRA|nr:hypothetical protein PsorP6_015890 [Peronosclerospora sorghi]